SELWKALEISGRAYAALGQSDKAQTMLDQSITVIEDLRAKVAGGEEQRQKFLGSRIEPYDAMIALMLAREENDRAFEYAERARARVLLDSLQGTRIDPAQFMTPAERTQEQEIVAHMAALNLKRIQENQKSDVDAAVVSRIEADLKQVRGDYESFSTQLYAVHPELRMQNRIPSITSNDVAAVIGREDTAVLEYVVTASVTHLFVFTSSSASPEVFSIPADRQDLANQIEDFRRKIADQDLGFGAASRSLYRLLVQPAETLLAGKQNLLIVPDAELWSLPFAALKSGSGRYLLQDHVLLYVPSLAALREMNRIRNRQTRKQPAKLLALGNPQVSRPSADQLANLYRDQALGPLPDAEKEVQSLAAIYGPSRSRVYTGKDARKDRFVAEASQYTILHIASHGILNDVSPLYSQLALAPGTDPGTEDGLLEAWEILRMKLHADLAVLSACETARGKVGSGEGMIGLSWALLVAGVPTTVASQWKVESKSTTGIMVEFHRLLVSKRPSGRFPVAAALREAALQNLDRPAYRHPFYWAGFIVIGAGS
ncbi:MAG TPA: CHAT domain-containing protein, partial [Acidobacteriota bacterium]|nr:CHAT domain-containing protein [Acidobacteriota bacterium]